MHGLHVRAAPLIGEIALGAEPLEPFGVQFLVELLDEAFEGRAFQLQPELLNRLGENLLDLCRRFFEVGHRWSKRSTRQPGVRLTLVPFLIPSSSQREDRPPGGE